MSNNAEAKVSPRECQHCEYDRKFPQTVGGGWMYLGNNGPYVPCPVCNSEGEWPRMEGRQ